MHKIQRWKHNCEDYKKGTLDFCSACEYYVPINNKESFKSIIITPKKPTPPIYRPPSRRKRH